MQDSLETAAIKNYLNYSIPLSRLTNKKKYNKNKNKKKNRNREIAIITPIIIKKRKFSLVGISQRPKNFTILKKYYNLG